MLGDRRVREDMRAEGVKADRVREDMSAEEVKAERFTSLLTNYL